MHNALKSATHWYARLNADDVSEADRQAFANWKAASAENAQAWQRVETTARQFDGIQPGVSKVTLMRPDRRRALKQLGMLAAVGTLGWMGYREQPWQSMLADYSTDIGQHHDIRLVDGTHLILNTESAIDVSYTAQSRMVILHKGEIMIETGHGPGSHAPFIVKTRQGRVQALGTRFVVRDHDDYSVVRVFDGATAITPESQPDAQRILRAGEQALFDNNHVAAPQAIPPGVDYWTRGIISAANMPLKDFIVEIRRYHTGILRCDPGIAELPISGAYPVDNLDAVLNSLARTYPIRIDTLTRYWITLKPAHSA